MSEFRLLVFEDDPDVHRSIKLLLPTQWSCYHVQKWDELPQRFFHAFLIDMHQPGNSQLGVEVLARLRPLYPEAEFMMFSGSSDFKLMEKCLQLGATKFFEKPLNVAELTQKLNQISSLWDMRSSKSQGIEWVGRTSAVSQKLLRQVAELKNYQSPILIQGETGSGKEVVFRLLNQQEISRPFVTVNLSSLSENLFESELFGHVKGAFTGADTEKMGLVELANGGDLFLDEIEALPVHLQPKLLRFLESGEYKKVGGQKNQFSQVRIIAATNENLETKVQNKTFREDLLFRLNGRKIKIPPLRERLEDLEELAEFFTNHNSCYSSKKFLTEAIEKLKAYPWPGNSRELKRVCEQLRLLSPLPWIREQEVAPLLTKTESLLDSELETRQGLGQQVFELEKKVIQKALERWKSIEEVSEKLQISKSHLYKKIRDLGIPKQ